MRKTCIVISALPVKTIYEEHVHSKDTCNPSTLADDALLIDDPDARPILGIPELAGVLK
jgi:hypothetical protein